MRGQQNKKEGGAGERKPGDESLVSLYVPLGLLLDRIVLVWRTTIQYYFGHETLHPRSRNMEHTSGTASHGGQI
jgi:hypothetical protein